MYDERYHHTDHLDVLRRRTPGPWEPWHPPPLHRIAHLVYLDGRLLDTWTEPVLGSQWEEQVDALDEEERRRLLRITQPAPAPEPPRPDHERTLAWLADRCGGETALLALDDHPLTTAPALPLDLAPPVVRERADAVGQLLDTVAGRWPEPELDIALETALVLLCREEPHLLGGGRGPAVLAGGIAWAVLKANGVLRPGGEVRVQSLQDVLGLGSTPAPMGGLVRGALVGYQPRTQEHRRPASVPDLLDLGRPELLTSATRRILVQVRDRALAARHAVLPPEVE